jgi:glycine cleavage system H protein
MAVVRGCNLPDDLLYDVDNNMWYRENPDGTVTLGMTMVATGMAGQLVAYTPKRVGKGIESGKSCATVESGKWVGPAKIAFDAEVVETNETLAANPKLANTDPYGEGWMLRVRPADWAAARAKLISGSDVAGPYEAKMTADAFVGCAAA